MVESASLLRRCTGNGTESSNLSLSATFFLFHLNPSSFTIFAPFCKIYLFELRQLQLHSKISSLRFSQGFMKNRFYIAFLFYLYTWSELYARVGSGQGHGRTSSGGGYHGGGYRGGSSGDGIDIGWLIYLIFKFPYISIPVLLILGIGFYISGKAARVGHQNRTITKYSHTIQQNNYSEGLQTLRAADSAFDENAMTQRVRNTFSNLQSYWSSGEIHKIRPFVSDGLYESFSIIYERYRKYNMRNDVKNLNIHSCSPIDIETSKHFHTITFKISASAIDSMRDIESDKFIGGSRTAESFTEYWSFIRKPGAQTLNKPGLLEGNCPNCASPLEMTDKTSCPACQAVICSGEYDWLLVEISQSDWQPEGSKTIPGVEEMSAIDPGFNRQAIEDRVSTSFWNVRRAEFEADCKKLSKYAHPNLMSKLNQQFKDRPGKYYADPAVGTVELLNVQANDQGLDRAYAKICWSGHIESRSEKRPIPDYYKSTIINQVYVFERNSGVQTEAGTSLSSAHCPGCGAPASDQTHGNCEYCGTPFNDGSKDWILTAIMPYAAYRSTVKIDRPQESPSSSAPAVSYQQSKNVDKEHLMAIIIHSMLDDNVIDQEEQSILMEFLQHMNMSVEHINQLMNGIHDGSYSVATPQKAIERKEMLAEVINLCLLDSKITKSERKVLESVGSKFGYGHADLKMMINKQRGQLYKEGKSYLKEHKK